MNESEAATLEPDQVGESTYRQTYRVTDILPPIKYHQTPGFYQIFEQGRDAEGMLPPRFFPLIPSGPKRPLVREYAIGAGLGTNDVDTERLLDLKPIIRTAPPRDIVYKSPSLLRELRALPPRPRRLLPMTGDNRTWGISGDVIDALYARMAWTSTSRKAAEDTQTPEEFDPPESTFEENSDMVQYRADKYEPRPEVWQQVADTWDHAQSRPPTDTPISTEQVTMNLRRQLPTRPCPGYAGFIPRSPVPSMLPLSPRSPHSPRSPDDPDLRRAQRRVHWSPQLSVEGHIGELHTPPSAAHERPCPGYAGYLPRQPIETALVQRAKEIKQLNTPYITAMTASFRKMPDSCYRIQRFAHRGPMSRTVTLTYPYNPFNKVEARRPVIV